MADSSVSLEGSTPPGFGRVGESLAQEPSILARGRPILGLLAVLLGAFISTLTGRLSTFGLADIRGAVHAGFDEGAWITTAQTVAQMLIAPFAVWAGTAFGPRRVLLISCTAFAALSVLIPWSPNLTALLSLQFLGGLASGCFIPLTIGFVLKNLPPRFWAYGIAIYALNLEFSLNISASLEGWYVEHLSWRWIFWQNVPLAVGMAIAIHFGIAREAVSALARRADLFGFITFGTGLALIYAALDQGNRLDWWNSGVVCGLLLAGGLLVVVFFVHEAVTPSPWLNLKALRAQSLPMILILVMLLRLTVLSTAYLIPQYLVGVRGYRALEVGDALVWIAIPQLITCPIAALMLRRADPRIAAGLGMMLVGIACFWVGHGLTAVWGSEQFLGSQLLQALGQSLALSGVVFVGVLRIRPAEALTFGAMLQVARLMGGEVGLAFVSTLARVREQWASYLIGLHVQAGAPNVFERLRGYAAVVLPAGGGADTAMSRAAALLGETVRRAATLQGIVDAFFVVGAVSLLALVLLVLLPAAPPGPASHRPLFAGLKRGSA